MSPGCGTSEPEGERSAVMLGSLTVHAHKRDSTDFVILESDFGSPGSKVLVGVAVAGSVDVPADWLWQTPNSSQVALD